MARVPPGALMQRAAAGLATHGAGLLRRVYGAPVVLLVGAGDNGGDALYAGARLARRGAAVTAVLLAPERAHAGGLAALTAAGGRALPAGDPAAVAAVRAARLVLDGIVGIGGSAGRSPPEPPPRWSRPSRVPPWWRSTCPAASTRTPARSRARRSGRTSR